MENEAEPVKEKRGRLGYYVAVALTAVEFLHHCGKSVVSIALVAMVKPTKHSGSSNSTNITTTDICPGEPAHSSTHEQIGNFEFDWDGEIQGSILASYSYGFVASLILGGIAAKRFGGRYVAGLSFMISTILTFFLPVAATLHYTAFIAIRVVQGIAVGFITPSRHLLQYKWFPIKDRPQFSGIISSAHKAAHLTTMAVSGVVIEAIGWRSVFYIAGGICVPFTIIWFYLVYDGPEVHPRILPEEKAYIINGRRRNSTRNTDVNQENLPTPWLSILLSAPFWGVVGICTAHSWLTKTFESQLPSYLKNMLHFSIKESGFLSALPSLSAWLFAIISGGISTWLQTQNYISHINSYRVSSIIATVGPAIFLLLVTLLGCNQFAIVACLVLATATDSFIYAGGNLNLMDLAPNFVATMSGIQETVSDSSGFVSPLVFGKILKGQQTLTNWHTGFYISMAIPLVTLIFYLITATDKEQSWNKPKEQTEALCQEYIDEQT